MQPQSPLQILFIVRQPSLSDSLAQVLSGFGSALRWTSAATPADVAQALESKLDLILADPFALEQGDTIAYYKALRCRLGAAPLIALLPADTPEYRDAAVQMGANYTLAWSETATELLPVMERLLGRKRLITGVSKYIENAASLSAPAGAPAFDPSLTERSRIKIERLAQKRSIPENYSLPPDIPIHLPARADLFRRRADFARYRARRPHRLQSELRLAFLRIERDRAWRGDRQDRSGGFSRPALPPFVHERH